MQHLKNGTQVPDFALFWTLLKNSNGYYLRESVQVASRLARLSQIWKRRIEIRDLKSKGKTFSV